MTPKKEKKLLKMLAKIRDLQMENLDLLLMRKRELEDIIINRNINIYSLVGSGPVELDIDVCSSGICYLLDRVEKLNLLHSKFDEVDDLIYELIGFINEKKDGGKT